MPYWHILTSSTSGGFVFVDFTGRFVVLLVLFSLGEEWLSGVNDVAQVLTHLFLIIRQAPPTLGSEDGLFRGLGFIAPHFGSQIVVFTDALEEEKVGRERLLWRIGIFEVTFTRLALLSLLSAERVFGPNILGGESRLPFGQFLGILVLALLDLLGVMRLLLVVEMGVCDTGVLGYLCDIELGRVTAR